MVEKIGNVTLDYSYYPGEDFYSDGDIEQDLLDIVKNYEPKDFHKVIQERKSWPILYHLSDLRENIVEWLPMDKTMKVLEVGSGCGAITGCLSKKAGEVTSIDLSKQRSLINAYRHKECDNVTIHVGNFQDIEPHLPCDYDYVCLIGVFEYGQSYIGGEKPFHDFFKIIKKHVKKGGKLVIAIENKFGMKYWAGCTEDHLGTFFSGIEGYPDGGYVRTFSEKGLKRIFEECGENNYHFYYPYPDYKFMTTLFSDERLPMVGELSNNIRNFDRERLHLFDEKNAFDALIQDGMFPFYSNSYMVVIGDDTNVAYSKYSNDRSADKAIKTEIVIENGVKKFRKYAASEKSAEHIRNIYTSYQLLSKRYEGSKLEMNRCELVDGPIPYVELEYIEGITLAEILDGYLQRKDEEGFKNLFKEYVERISYGEEMAVADYDMIFANILVNQDRWIVIDYEWTMAERIATKEIAFRSLYCYLLENGRRNQCDKEWMIQYLGIKPEEVEEYQKKEALFQESVMGDRKSMAQLIQNIGGKIFNVDYWRNEIQLQQAKQAALKAALDAKEIQIYEDRGDGYSVEHMSCINKVYRSDYEIEFELNLDGCVKNLRIDPLDEPCVCKITKLLFNGQDILKNKKEVITGNGHSAGEVMIFATMDPNIYLSVEQLNPGEENILGMALEIVSMSRQAGEEMGSKLLTEENKEQLMEEIRKTIKQEVKQEVKQELKEEIKKKLHIKSKN